MEAIDLIVSSEEKIEEVVTRIKKSKSIETPSWVKLVKEYDVSKHEIVTDKINRKDKLRKDGSIEKVARVTYGQQKLAAKRMTQMAFAIPVKRIYETGEDPVKKAQARAIEAIYAGARIDAVNIKRMNAYFAACEIATIWFPVKETHTKYGFNSEWKLKCVTYSPMDRKFSRLESANLYPVFDKFRDMIALAFEYTLDEDGKKIVYFHLYTAEEEKIFRKESGKWEDATGEETPVIIEKIPGAYLWRPMPIWEDTTNNTNEIELALSRQSDIIRKNSAPIIKVKGELLGTDKPENESAREVYQLKGDGDIGYVTWQQQVEALKFYVDTLKQNTEEELQLPNLSFENVKGLSAMSGEARKTLLTDPHLKVGDESGDIIEFLEREYNVIKSFLGQINTAWKSSIGNLEVEHVVTPFIQNDEAAQIDKITKATQKPVMSQKTGIQQLGMVKNEKIDEEYKLLQEEEKRMNTLDFFEPTE